MNNALMEIIPDMYNICVVLTEIVNDLNECIVSNQKHLKKSYNIKINYEFGKEFIKENDYIGMNIEKDGTLIIDVDKDIDKYLKLGIFVSRLQEEIHRIALEHMMENPDIIAEFPNYYKFFKDM